MAGSYDTQAVDYLSDFLFNLSTFEQTPYAAD